MRGLESNLVYRSRYESLLHGSPSLSMLLSPFTRHSVWNLLHGEAQAPYHSLVVPMHRASCTARTDALAAFFL